MLERSDLVDYSGGIASERLDRFIGNNIRQARIRQGLSLAELAQKLGVQDSLILKYEVGTDRVSASMLYRIAVTLHVTLSELFGVARF